MAINKKLIHFKNKSKFTEELANNNINDTSICFIQDTQAIWTHGQLYNCASIPADKGTLAYAEYTGTSTTAAVDTKSGYFPETLTEGASVAVKFEGNISYISTLNVNGAGAKNVYYKGNSLSGGSISRYNTYLFVYDGSYYRIVGIDTDTHHSAKNVVTSSATSKSNATATNGNVYLNLIENSTVRSKHKIVGTGATTVTSDSSGNITIDTTLPNYIVPFTEDDLSTWLNAVNDNDYFTSSALTDDLTNISNAITNNVPLVLQGPNAELFPVVGHVSSGFLSLHILTFWENEPTSWLLTYNITSNMGDIRKYSIVDYATNTALASALRAKQDTLVSGETIKTINGTSILGSGDITISGGSSDGAYAEVSHGTSDTTFTLTPNVFHIWDEVTELNITLGSETSGVANEYLFQFTSGSEPTALSLPDDIKWANDSAPTIEANKIYQISVLKGLGSVLEFNNAPTLIDNKVTLSISGTKYLVSLQYAAASDIVVKVRTIDGLRSVNVLSGEVSKTASSRGPMVDSDADIESITPIVDNKYNYIW